jgi:hypothetical protein
VSKTFAQRADSSQTYLRQAQNAEKSTASSTAAINACEKNAGKPGFATPSNLIVRFGSRIATTQRDGLSERTEGDARQQSTCPVPFGKLRSEETAMSNEMSMLDLMVANYTRACQRLACLYQEVVRNHWRWLTAPSSVTGIEAPADAAKSPPEAEAVAGDLEKRTWERLQKGFAPPREIHDVRNRGRIDWTRVPDWARAVDPELFTGCSHEG